MPRLYCIGGRVLVYFCSLFSFCIKPKLGELEHLSRDETSTERKGAPAAPELLCTSRVESMFLVSRSRKSSGRGKERNNTWQVVRSRALWMV